jgi:hypothetical protein
MQYTRKIILITLIASWSLFVCGLSISSDSLRYELLMNGKMLKDINVNDSLIGSLDITSNRLILLSTNKQYYLLGWGGMVPFGKSVEGNISSFAFTCDSSLLTVRNNELCYFDSLGGISVLYKLPDKGMCISAGKYVMYIYDCNKNKDKNALYVVAKGGKYAKLFDVPTPITSVVEISNSLLFATGSALLNYDPKNKALKVLVKLQKEKEIVSIAVDSVSNRIFFSTESAIYALKDSSAVIISDEFGGVLRFLNDGLVVFNPEKKFLFGISGFENEIVSKMQTFKTATPVNERTTTDIITNSTVINLVKTKLSDDSIINLINNSEVNFNVGVDSMIFLSNQNVSSAVIMAMKNAMKLKTGNSSNVNNPDNILVTNNQTSQNNNTSTTNITINNRFYIIAGSYPTEQQANDAATDLIRKGFPDSGVVGKNSYGSYRIAYKGYATNEEAAKDLIQIRQGINSTAWIFEKK